VKAVLIGVYSDGSNSNSLLENALLERDLLFSAESELRLGELLAAKDAVERNYGSYTSYLIVLVPETK
jgi:hypothetical protein